MDISTGRTPGPMQPESRHPCMLMPQPRLPCWRSRRPIRASTTSPSQATTSRPRRPAESLASTPTSGFLLSPDSFAGGRAGRLARAVPSFRSGSRLPHKRKVPPLWRDLPYSKSPELALSLARALSLLARLLAAALLLARLLTRVLGLLTRIWGLLVRVLVWISHSGSPLLKLTPANLRAFHWFAREPQFRGGFNVSVDWRRRGG